MTTTIGKVGGMKVLVTDARERQHAAGRALKLAQLECHENT